MFRRVIEVSCFTNAAAVCSGGLHMYLYIFIVGINYKTTTILLEGKRVKLQLW